jgi:hypothetical protein
MATWNYNDGGRLVAGYKGKARDCVCRAIAIALELPYDEVYAQVNEFAEQTRGRAGRGSDSRTGVHRPVYQKYLESLGWKWTPTMKIGSGCKVHLTPEELPPGRIICKCSKHLVAVIDGIIQDNHDSSRGGTRCVYGYYTKA